MALRPLQEGDKVTTGASDWAPGQLPPTGGKPPVDTYTNEDTTQEVEIEKYGYCFEPTSTARVTQSPAVNTDSDD